MAQTGSLLVLEFLRRDATLPCPAQWGQSRSLPPNGTHHRAGHGCSQRLLLPQPRKGTAHMQRVFWAPLPSHPSFPHPLPCSEAYSGSPASFQNSLFHTTLSTFLCHLPCASPCLGRAGLPTAKGCLTPEALLSSLSLNLLGFCPFLRARIKASLPHTCVSHGHPAPSAPGTWLLTRVWFMTTPVRRTLGCAEPTSATFPHPAPLHSGCSVDICYWPLPSVLLVYQPTKKRPNPRNSLEWPWHLGPESTE